MSNYRALLIWASILLFSIGPMYAGNKVVIDQDNNFILNGRPFFPFGMNGGPPATLLWRDGTPGYEELARGGINFFRTYHSSSGWNADTEAQFVAQLNEAERTGLYCYVNLQQLSLLPAGDTAREAEIRRVITTYKDRPGVFFWKSADEPAWGSVSIPDLLAAYKLIKSLDPDHPLLMNHAPRNTVEELREYCVACDATGADIYPVSVPMGKNSGLPNKEISVVGDYTKRMTEVVYGQKPIVMVLQNTFSGTMPPNVLVRPTFYQQRYMTYQAIICGAKGLAWFGWSQALSEEDAPYGWNWTYWVDVLKPLLQEIKVGSELNRVITAPSHDFLLGVSGAGDVEYLARELDGRLYLLASKRESPTAAVTFSSLPASCKAEAMFENRTLNITNGAFTDTFNPNAVHVYRLFSPLMESNFDQSAVADPSSGSYPLPQGWNLSSTLTTPDKCYVVNSGTEFTPEPADPTLARTVKFHDPANSTGNAQLYREFPAQNTGIITTQFDVRFAQTNSAFLFRVCNEGSVSLASSYAAHLIFEGATPWAAGGGPGTISYMVERDPAKYVNSGVKYEANKWYTVRMETDLTAAKFRIYFGLRGKPLQEITAYGGQAFITRQAIGGEHITSIQKLCFATASLVGDANGVHYIDNVRIEGPLPLLANDKKLSQLRQLNKGDMIRLENAIVTAGTDQLGGPFFYIQDNYPGGSGMRVRVSGVTVREGDRVSIVGTLAQTSDNGIIVRNNGELEIQASQVVVNSSGGQTPTPVHLRASQVGGGFLGEMEYIDSTRGYWPRMKGVWPQNNAGVTGLMWDPLNNLYPPLFNVGTVATVTGRVTKMCREYPAGHSNYDFYVDDGSLAHDGWYDPGAYGDESNHPRGIRVRMASDITTISGYGEITGACVSVTGIVGAISSSNIVSNTGVRNVAIIRPRVVTRDIRIISPAQ